MTSVHLPISYRWMIYIVWILAIAGTFMQSTTSITTTRSTSTKSAFVIVQKRNKKSFHKIYNNLDYSNTNVQMRLDSYNSQHQKQLPLYHITQKRRRDQFSLFSSNHNENDKQKLPIDGDWFNHHQPNNNQQQKQGNSQQRIESTTNDGFIKRSNKNPNSIDPDSNNNKIDHVNDSSCSETNEMEIDDSDVGTLPLSDEMMEKVKVKQEELRTMIRMQQQQQQQQQKLVQNVNDMEPSSSSSRSSSLSLVSVSELDEPLSFSSQLPVPLLSTSKLSELLFASTSTSSSSSSFVDNDNVMSKEDDTDEIRSLSSSDDVDENFIERLVVTKDEESMLDDTKSSTTMTTIESSSSSLSSSTSSSTSSTSTSFFPNTFFQQTLPPSKQPIKKWWDDMVTAMTGSATTTTTSSTASVGNNVDTSETTDNQRDEDDEDTYYSNVGMEDTFLGIVPVVDDNFNNYNDIEAKNMFLTEEQKQQAKIDFFNRIFEKAAIEAIRKQQQKQQQQQQQQPTVETDRTVEIAQQAIIRRPNRRLYSASYVMPHPAKISWGGEDAVFTTGRTFGLFDGVSGALKKDGIPLYSTTLAEEMIKLNIISTNITTTKLESISINNSDDEDEGEGGDEEYDDSYGLSIQQLIQQLLVAAEIADDKATGASTAIVGSISDTGLLNILNVGDSTGIVVRIVVGNTNNTTTNKDDNGTNSNESNTGSTSLVDAANVSAIITARTMEISHYFECPYQLCIDSPDRPRDGTKLRDVQLQPNDIVFLGSDGIFDNLFDDEIAAIIANVAARYINDTRMGSSSLSSSRSTSLSSKTLEEIAVCVSERAREVSLVSSSEGIATPYAYMAKRYGDVAFKDGIGGKVDDISCIVIQYRI